MATYGASAMSDGSIEGSGSEARARTGAIASRAERTVERIARLIFDHARESGLPVVKVTVWETPTSFATYFGEA